MKAPLEGIKVLDLSRFISGPYCGMLLGDLGADVIKVEKRGKGDDTRGLPPFVEGESIYAFAMNRNKRSLELDFRSEEGKTTLMKLVEKADIIIENFKPGTMDKMGCGWNVLHELNPGLIMCSISGFGADGPYKDKAGFDAAAQAMSGLMSISGESDGAPMLYGTYSVDYTTAMYATIGILAALRQREENGVGQQVELSLLDCAATLLLSAIPMQKSLGVTQGRIGNRDRYMAPGNCFPTKDGEFMMIVAGGDAHFQSLTKAMGKEYLLEDERFNDKDRRFANAAAIEKEVKEWTKQHNLAEISAILDACGIVSAKVETVKDVVENPQLLYRKKLIELDHPKMGTMTMMGAPFNFSDTELDLSRPAPTLGQHNEEVLMDWLGDEGKRR